jgi:hypothetical protein
MHDETTLASEGRGKSTSIRWVRAVAYTLIALGGLLMLLSPLLWSLFGEAGVAMCVFLIVGGALAAFGAYTRRWWGEFTGLPLLAPAFIILGFLTWESSREAVPFFAAANLCLISAFGGLLFTRWRVVLAIYRVADRLADGPERPQHREYE